MKSKIIIITLTLIFFGTLFPKNTYSQSTIRVDENNSYGDILFGYDFSKAFVLDIVWGKKIGFWVGIKVTTTKPEGKKYNFSQDRAETFYDSEFIGYSDKLFYSLGGGLSFAPFKAHTIIYVGIELLESVQYRQYYDDTFTTWSRSYYIESGRIEKLFLDITAGLYFQFIEGLLIGVGYSKGTSNFIIHVGVRMRGRGGINEAMPYK